VGTAPTSKAGNGFSIEDIKAGRLPSFAAMPRRLKGHTGRGVVVFFISIRGAGIYATADAGAIAERLLFKTP